MTIIIYKADGTMKRLEAESIREEEFSSRLHFKAYNSWQGDEEIEKDDIIEMKVTP